MLYTDTGGWLLLVVSVGVHLSCKSVFVLIIICHLNMFWKSCEIYCVSSIVAPVCI